MSTEGSRRDFEDLDLWPTDAVVRTLVEDQAGAVAAVAARIDDLRRAADAAADRLRGETGRLIYVGAGTSGRIAAQDGVELSPTYDWPEARLLVLMAGGEGAITASVEGAEDDAAAAAAAIQRARVGPDDVVIGAAASGRTPYTVAALSAAAAAGALTVGLANNADGPLLRAVRHPILLDTGPEVVAGSTRMKAGTAQKIALNALSTAIMVRLGGVYRGEMVAMRTSNAKLRARAVRIVSRLSGATEGEARAALQQSDGQIKVAILVARGVSLDDARRRVAGAAGDLRAALGDGDAP